MQKDSSLPCAAWGKTDASYCCGCKHKTHSKAELAIHTVTPSLYVGFLILCQAFSSGISTLLGRMTSHCNRSFCSKGVLISKVAIYFLFFFSSACRKTSCKWHKSLPIYVALFCGRPGHNMFILAFKETHFRMCECLVVIVGLETYKSLLICVKKQS